MPEQEVSHLYQRAVLWPATGIPCRDGQPQQGAPVEIACRWNNTQRNVTLPNGTTIAIDATIVVAQVVPDDSLMALGTLEDWQGTGSAEPDSDLCIVKTLAETPDFRGRAVQRTLAAYKYRHAAD
jgi:hypothetical protein